MSPTDKSAAAPPLTGLKVLELAGLAPAPFCGLLLASYGASVLRIDRPTPTPRPTSDNLTTHKSSIPLDLKNPRSLSLLKSLIRTADVLIDPFRPGVLEKLNLDPATTLLRLNPRLIIVRLTGFRKDGKYKDMAGHDINYLAASGVLSMLGEKRRPPVPPANILADFAGGGLVAFTGILLALISRGMSGKGQVVDANMVDGVSFLGTFPRLLRKTPMWDGERGTNNLDGGAPYYRCYECKDSGEYMSVGALEPQFFQKLLEGLGLSMEDVVPPGKGWRREDKRSWEYMTGVFDEKFRTKTRREWEKIFDGTDACCVPVLKMAEMEEQGYELRPIVGLEGSPGREVVDKWEGRLIAPGHEGEETLKDWKGWSRGEHYEIGRHGAWLLNEKSKL